MSYEGITDRTNAFHTTGLSDEAHALLRYLEEAKAATGADLVATSTTDHPPMTNSGNTSRHRMAGTNGEGLAVDCRMRQRGTAPGQHRAVFDIWALVESQLHELIYAYPPAGRRADGTTGPYNIKAGRRVAPYAVSDHKDHVHVSVRAGTVVRFPAPPKPAAPPRPVEITVGPHHPEDKMRPILVKVPALDDQGKGWITLPNVDASKVVSIVARGSFPPDDGYWDLPVFGRQQRGPDTIVQISESDPRSYSELTVWVAD